MLGSARSGIGRAICEARALTCIDFVIINLRISKMENCRRAVMGTRRLISSVPRIHKYIITLINPGPPARMMRAVCHSDIRPINIGMKDMSACHELALRTLASTGRDFSMVRDSFFT